MIILLLFYYGQVAWGGSWQQELWAPTARPSSQALFVGGMIGSSLLGSLGKQAVVYPVQEYFQTQLPRPFGGAENTIERMGRWTPNLAYALGMEIWGRTSGAAVGEQRALMMIKATSYASLLTLLLKNTVREKRPASSRLTSYPSGHTTTSFAFAGVVGANHPWYWGVGAYLLATLVGIQRISSNAHFLHDVIAGAAIGSAYGIGISALAASAETEQKREKKSAKTTTTFAWGVYPLTGGAMFAVVLER